MGLIFSIIIGSAFYRLATEYKKSKWGYAIVGFIVFYVISYVSFFIIAIIQDKETLEYASSSYIYFLGVILPYILGLIIVVILYIFLDNKWGKAIDKANLNNIGKKDL
ncbi:MAG: hypothetical protein JXR05_03450 [Flavobacteriaceae bacterium]